MRKQTNNRKVQTKPTKIFAIGGMEEIGKNTYCIEYDDEIVIVDAGIKFANATLPGFDGMVANFEYLQNTDKKVVALCVTHGHEDHIGGIPHLLRFKNVEKIYAGALPAKLIDKRLSEYKDIKRPIIEVIDENKMIKTKHFTIDYFRVCHSIPDAFGVFIGTPNGNLVSTGDFRFDFATFGDQADLLKIHSISKRGVDALLCECTSAEIPGFSESERYILTNIYDYMKNAKGRIFISTFASNLSRVEEIIAMAVGLNRKICIIGRSMEANIKISRNLKYLTVPETSFISHKEIANYNDDEILVILTGSQGEEMAALNVMANNNHSRITFKPSDTVILSSNPIPGNYFQVEQMINKLYRLGLTVYENHPNKKIHASGHATRSEQQLMIKAINPKYLVPIHGEYKMFRAIQRNAEDLGFDRDKVIIAQNGQITELLNGEMTLTDQYVPSSPTFINGKDVTANAQALLKDRLTLSSDGILTIQIATSINKKKILTLPNLSTRGCFFSKESMRLVNKIVTSSKEIAENVIKTASIKDFKQQITTKIENEVKAIVWKWRKKNPIINIAIIDEMDIKNLIAKKDYIEFIEKKDFKESIEEDIEDIVSDQL
ncbi:ribonuclease J [Ureaplasma canigenitalium]|uniref:ribonuclease J n=1 Tax=Ureaplasma canigenitalium TaxID=42092 RepID=UPI00068DF924|nr:ribonuclease J [Ureaplasma canigenitalium]